MPIGAVLGGAAIGAFGSIFGASQQASAADNAAKLQYQEQQNALDFEKQQWSTTQANAAPFVKAGQSAVETLSGLLSQPGQGLLAPWTGTFKVPTAAEAAATPGYQFERDQGLLAEQDSAAARGGLLTGGTLKGIANYAEGLASTNYQQAFNNALTQYQTAYNTFQNNQTNTYNRLAGVAGTGQTATTQLGGQGVAAAQTAANTFLTGGAQIGQDIQNAGAATASGYVGSANAIGGGLSGIGGLAMLQQILQNNPNLSNIPYIPAGASDTSAPI